MIINNSRLKENNYMNILLWVILGALSGWVASLIMKTDAQQGFLGDAVVGIIGAFIGGFVMNLFGNSGVNGLNLYSILVAVLGAIALIVITRSVRRTV